MHATPHLPDAKKLPMLKTVRDACTPHKMALDFSMAEQIEDLAAVIGGAGDGQAFFAKNHITAGMRQLFDLGLRRLAGRSDQAVFELTQARTPRSQGAWGDTVTLASDFVDQDPRFQDFVMAHELLPLRLPSHGRLFKALMSAPVPGWRELDEQPGTSRPIRVGVRGQ